MAKFKLHINISDLQQYDADELCQLQNEFHNDQINDTLIFEPELTEQDLLTALHVDAFYPSEFLLDVPVWFKATLTTMFIVNMIWSCAHNMRTLLSIAFNKSCWSSTNVLISALAISDLLTVCCATPTEVSTIINGIHVWEFGSFGCYFLPFVQSTAILSNALILCYIAYDRYVCVVKMEHFTQRKPSWFTAALIASVWIFSIGVSVPSLYLWRAHLFIMSGVYEEQPYGVDFCSVFQVCVSNPSYDTSSDSFYYIYHVCLCGAIFCPLFLLFTAIYARIGHFLWVRRVVGGGSGAKQQIKRKKRIALALLGLVVSFFVCRMPNWIFVILAMSQLIEEMTPTIYMMKVTFVFLSVLNTSLNPMLYVLVDEPMSKTLSSCSGTLFDGFCLCQSTDSPNQVSFNGDNQSPSQLMITKSTKFETTEDGGTDGPSPSVLAIIEEINKATANNKPAETH